jgi:hypothetical protein
VCNQSYVCLATEVTICLLRTIGIALKVVCSFLASREKLIVWASKAEIYFFRFKKNCKYFARYDKDLGPQLGNQLTGERPRKTAET